jgi:hypothetical protein
MGTIGGGSCPNSDSFASAALRRDCTTNLRKSHGFTTFRGGTSSVSPITWCVADLTGNGIVWK